MVRALLIAAALVVVGVPQSAVADSSLPNPAIAQYVESMPTSSGPIVPGMTKPHVKKLSSSVLKGIAAKGGKDASVIEQIATSSAYGAPQTTLSHQPGHSHQGSITSTAAVTTTTAAVTTTTVATTPAGTSTTPAVKTVTTTAVTTTPAATSSGVRPSDAKYGSPVANLTTRGTGSRSANTNGVAQSHTASAPVASSPATFWTDGSGGSRLLILGLLLIAATASLAVAGRRVRATDPLR